MVKPSAIMAAKAADDGHRDGGGRNEHRPETLQKYHDHDEHQDAGFEKRLINLGYGLPDELRGVEADGVLQAFREILAHLGHGLVNIVGDGDGVGLGKGEDDDLGRAESAAYWQSSSKSAGPDPRGQYRAGARSGRPGRGSLLTMMFSN